MEEAFVCVLAIFIAFLNSIDLVFFKHRKSVNKKKTEWFYKNKDYDRNLDERADKNNYRIY